MRNLKLVDAVIQLHGLANMILEETGDETLSEYIHNCGDQVHLYSIDDDKANTIAQSIIKQVKE
jgi:phosphosulfolactate synthase (CoM biosynthesis protein A)